MEQKSTGVWAGGFFVKQSNSSEAETGARSVWDQELGASTAAGAFAATPPPPPLKRTAHTQTKKKAAAKKPRRQARADQARDARAPVTGVLGDDDARLAFAVAAARRAPPPPPLPRPARAPRRRGAAAAADDAQPDDARLDAQRGAAESRIPAQKLEVVYASNSFEGNEASPCLVCPCVVDHGGRRKAARVRLTFQSEVSCDLCNCMLGFDGCNNTPRRGGYVVPACRSCVGELKRRVSMMAPVQGTKEHGLPRLEALINETDPQNLKQTPLWNAVKCFSGSCAEPNAIKEAHGKEGLAARVASQIALLSRAKTIATALRVLPQRKLRIAGLVKGSKNVPGRDVQRGRGTSRDWDRRMLLNREVSGDASLEAIEVAAAGTRDRWSDAVKESDGKGADERLIIIQAETRATRLEATLAHSQWPPTRLTATSRADELAELVRKREMQKAAEEASRTDAERGRLAEKRKKDALRRSGVSWAEQADTDPRDGAACIENHFTRVDDDKKEHRKKAAKRRKSERKASGLDHVQTAIEKSKIATAKRLAAFERARNDDGSGRKVVCKTEGCKYHGVESMFYGDSIKKCYGCVQPMAFM